MRIIVENQLEMAQKVRKSKSFYFWVNQLEIMNTCWARYQQKVLENNDWSQSSSGFYQVVKTTDFKIWLGAQSWLQILNPLNSIFTSDKLGEYMERYRVGFEFDFSNRNDKALISNPKNVVVENKTALKENGWLKREVSYFSEESKLRKLLEKLNLENNFLKTSNKLSDDGFFDINDLRSHLRDAFLGLGACNVQLPKLHNEIVINAGSAYLLRVLTNYVSPRGKCKAMRRSQAQELTVFHEMAHFLQVNLRDNGFFWELGDSNSFVTKGVWQNNGLRMFSLLWGFLKTYEKKAPTLNFAGSWLREAHADVLSVLWYSQVHTLSKEEVLDLLSYRSSVRKEQSAIICREPFAGISVHETHGALSILKQRIASGVVDVNVLMNPADLLKEARLCAIASLKLRAAVLEKRSLINKQLKLQANQLICLSIFLTSLELGFEQTFEQLWQCAPLFWIDNPALVAKTSHQIKALKVFDDGAIENKTVFFGEINKKFGSAKITEPNWFIKNCIDVNELNNVFG